MLSAISIMTSPVTIKVTCSFIDGMKLQARIHVYFMEDMTLRGLRRGEHHHAREPFAVVPGVLSPHPLYDGGLDISFPALGHQ